MLTTHFESVCDPAARPGLAGLALAALMLVACDDAPLAPTGSDGSALVNASAAGQDVTETYFFGSSTTDAGNLNIAVPGVLPSPPYFMGRASNGPVWAEYFADLLGTDATPSFLGGSNYAVGGARTCVVNLGFIPPITAQVADYLTDAASIEDPRALHVLQSGANDLTAAKLQPPQTAKQTMRAAVQCTEAMLTDLYNAGARSFVVTTLPALPTAPTSPILPDGTNLATLTNDAFCGPGSRFTSPGGTRRSLRPPRTGRGGRSGPRCLRL